LLHIFVDADACPVKPEVYRVASRCRLNVTLVANSWMRIPNEPWIALEVVGNGCDAADDWIVEHVEPHDIVVTTDIPLASRCLKEGARGVTFLDVITCVDRQRRMQTNAMSRECQTTSLASQWCAI